MGLNENFPQRSIMSFSSVNRMDSHSRTSAPNGFTFLKIQENLPNVELWFWKIGIFRGKIALGGESASLERSRKVTSTASSDGHTRCRLREAPPLVWAHGTLQTEARVLHEAGLSESQPKGVSDNLVGVGDPMFGERSVRTKLQNKPLWF